jgi:signal transduction histidine kinase
VTEDRTSGIDCVGTVPWGTHLCQFYSTSEELADTLVPYFAAGLQQDEFCVWVTSDPSGVEGAKAGLRKAAPHLGRRIDVQQIEVWDSRDWYLHGGHFDADRVFGQWLAKEERALAFGYKGVRLTGDMTWIEKEDWPDFMVYEAEVNRVFRQHRMIGLCSYPLNRCAADGVLEVIRNHQFALGRIAGEWERIENSSLKLAENELRRLKVHLDAQVELSEQSRRLSTYLLEQQDEERRRIAAQLRDQTAQDVVAIAIYIAGLQQRTRTTVPSGIETIVAECDRLCRQSLEKILTLSHLLHPPLLDHFGLAFCLTCYIDDFSKRSGIHVEFVAGPDTGRLPLEKETQLFRVAQEGLSTILRHSESLKVSVRLERQADQVILQIEDSGRGNERAGLEILAIQERLRKIGGRFEMRYSTQGTTLTASVGVS